MKIIKKYNYLAIKTGTINRLSKEYEHLSEDQKKRWMQMTFEIAQIIKEWYADIKENIEKAKSIEKAKNDSC